MNKTVRIVSDWIGRTAGFCLGVSLAASFLEGWDPHVFGTITLGGLFWPIGAGLYLISLGMVWAEHIGAKS